MQAAGKYNPIFDNGLISAAFTITDTSNIDNVRLTSSTSEPVSFHAYAAKLEPGRYQTLAHKEGDAWVLNEIPDYATELLKCQRYFRVIDQLNTYSPQSSTYVPANLYFPDMRTIPIVTVHGDILDGGSNVIPNATFVSASFFKNSADYMRISVSVSGIVKFKNVWLSAEL